MADHLLRLENENDKERNLSIKEEFTDEQLFVVTTLPWYVDIVSF